MSVAKIIQPKLHAITGGLFGNWLPSSLVAVGDFGILKECQFQRLGTIKEYDANFVSEEVGHRNTLQFKDKLEISVNSLAEATAGHGLGGKVSLKMAQRGAFLYHLMNSVSIRPANTRAFNEELSKALLSEKMNFPDDGVVITEVLQAKKATIVVCDTNEGELDLQTNFKPGGDAFLAGAKGKVKATNSRGSIFQFIAQDDITALIRIVKPTFAPPPGGPGTPMRGASRAVSWLKGLFRERQLHVADLIISHRPEAPSQIVVTLGQGGPEFLLQQDNITVKEMLATATMENKSEEEVDLKIEEVKLRSRYREASG